MTYVAATNISMLGTQEMRYNTITLILCKYCTPDNLSSFKIPEMFNLLR